MDECLIDTDILSFYLKGDQTVKAKVEEYLFVKGFERLNISEITYYEIKAGLEHRRARQQIRQFEEFSAECRILKLTKNSLDITANRYGKLKRRGIDIGTPDLMVAGIAIDNNLILVTNNLEHFRPVEGLRLTNWKM